MKSIFSNQFGWLLSGMLIVALISCSTPSQKQSSVQNKVDNTKKEITENQTQLVEKAKGYAYGGDFALSLDPAPSKYSQTAKEFTSRTVAVLGTPNLEEVNQLKTIITNLMSDQRELIAKGKKLLETTDREVYELQDNIKELNIRLELKEQKLKEVSQENAALATTWKRITNSFWWIVWIVGIGLVLSMVGQLLPPPYSSIISIIAIPIGLFIKFLRGLVPAASNFAGVVSSKVYDNTKLTLAHVIEAVEDAKTKEPEAIAKIIPFLSQTTSKEVSKPVITDIKRELGYV